MTTLTFDVPCVPVAQPRQRHRIIESAGRTYASNYTPAKHPVNAFKAACQFGFQAAEGHCTLHGPVCLIATFVMPRPKNKVWKTKVMNRYIHTSKPDLDNLVKALKDALSGLAWRDDDQVASLTCSKWVAAGDEQPHVEITITQLD